MKIEGIVGVSIIILLIAYVSCVGAKNTKKNKKEGMSAAEAKQLKLPTLHESRAYCPYKPLYGQELPWLVKVGKEWFCYENQDATGNACNYSGTLPPPDDLWGFSEHLQTCERPPGVVSGRKIAHSCSTFDCPPGHPKFPDYLDLACKEKGCDVASCCQPNPKCSTYKCPSNFYTRSVLKDYADQIECAGSRCTEYECCNSSATDKLPATQIWPMTKKGGTDVSNAAAPVVGWRPRIASVGAHSPTATWDQTGHPAALGAPAP